KADISKFEDDVIRLIQNGYQIAAILTDIITTPLFKPKKDAQGNVVLNDENIVQIETDSDGMQVINEPGIKATLAKSSNTYK
ncbi:hypothetical protein, partial [Staphylococcus aureus]|uniref:hypothetical protein n=1 Tax=Staphylococcus aureus TaxID=1280 RepID=UPI00301D0010